MLTNEQREIFRRILELNWNYSQETNNSRKFELFEQLNQAKTEMKESMGEEAYASFIVKGMRMFAPKEEIPVMGSFDENGDAI